MILYYSLLKFNPSHPKAINDVQSPYRLHLVTSMPFTGRSRQNCRILWRLDGNQVMMQSTQPPNTWEHVLQQSGYLSGPPETKAINLNLTEGGLYWFRVVCNPAYRGQDENNKSITIAITSPEERRQWLVKRLSESGMDVQMVNESDKKVLKFMKNDGHRVVILTARYDGLLRISNPVLAEQQIAAGMGRGKAFGMGLVSLVPAETPF